MVKNKKLLIIQKEILLNLLKLVNHVMMIIFIGHIFSQCIIKTPNIACVINYGSLKRQPIE